MTDPTSARALLARTAELAADHLEGCADRAAGATASVEEIAARFAGPLPEGPTDAERVIDQLVSAVDQGLVGNAGGRYFGFVIGGSVPAALAADWLASTWDQNAGLYATAPAAAALEELAGAWLAELLGLPAGVSFGFVTGCQMAHVTALAAARQHLLARAGWDVNQYGLGGAPPIRVLAGGERHVTIDRALRLLGIGTASITTIPVDAQGRMRAEALRAALGDSGGPTVVCAQSGNVNTGACDPLSEIADAAQAAEAWLHVDGAFGLWAAASPAHRHLVDGAARADSWATDAHKWLNVPYDSGLVFCAHPGAHRGAMGVHASYLVHAEADGPRDPLDYNPEFSRRARGIPVYAALCSLGRSGVAELVQRSCAHARRFAEALHALDCAEVLNEVVLNQVLVRFHDDDARTQAIVDAVQAEGTCWMSATTWQGKRAMRISVSGWATTRDDVDASIAAIDRVAERMSALGTPVSPQSALSAGRPLAPEARNAPQAGRF